MKATLRHIILTTAAMLALAACSHDEPQPNNGKPTQIPIRFTIDAEASKPNSRVIFENKDTLQNLCNIMNPEARHESIGVWADYQIGNIVNSNIFNNTRIHYVTNKYSGFDRFMNGGDPYWDFYLHDDNGTGHSVNRLYWVVGGEYKFRFFAPQKQCYANINSASNATNFMIDYNTELLQSDMLVGYKKVDTNDKDFKFAEPFPVTMKHVMSLVKFEFGFQDHDDNDYLIGCWLENTSGVNGFATAGVLLYGEEGNEEAIEWSPVYRPGVGVPYYVWTCNSGLEFRRTTGADNTVTYKYATAFSNPIFNVGDTDRYAMTDADQGALFARNGGWLCVMPQTLIKDANNNINTDLCFVTLANPASVQRVRLPATVGSDTFSFLPGYRYVVHVWLSKSDVKADIEILDWENVNSSVSIDF